MYFIKKGCCVFFVFLILVFLFYLVNSSEIKEFQRWSGLLKDKYESIGFEQAVKKVRTWNDAESYLLGHLRFDSGQPSSNFETIHSTGKTVCFGAAIMAKALLSDNHDRYEVDLYVYKNKSGSWSHMIALVKDKETGRYGSLGINACDCLTPGYLKEEEVFNKIKFVFFWKDYKMPEKISSL